MEASVVGRRRTATRHSAEDQALDQIAKEVLNSLVHVSFLVSLHL